MRKYAERKCASAKAEGFQSSLSASNPDEQGLKCEVKCPKKEGVPDRVVDLDTCLREYMNVMAFGQKENRCHRCGRGKSNRDNFAEGAEIHAGLVRRHD